MPREREDYRDNLEDLLEFFGGKRLISKIEAANYLGLDPRTAAKRFDIGKNGISLPTLARRLSR